MTQIAEPEFLTFSALPQRRPLRWPERKPIALTAFLHFEDWDLHPSGATADPRFSEIVYGPMPNYITHSWFEYGNRVGIYRVLDALDRASLRVTVAANSSACIRYPRLVAEFLRRGYEFAAHGRHANHMISSCQSEEEESTAIHDCIDTVERACGSRPLGWIGQSYGESSRTPQLLANAGIKYVVDWANDEQPYVMNTKPPLLSLPSNADLDDVEVLYHRKMFPWQYPAVVREAFEQLHADGDGSGRFFGLHIHPWLFGKPFLVKYLEDTLSVVSGSQSIWRATGGELASYVQELQGKP